MLRDESVSLREGEMYHGRYRILRCIEAKGTGAAYEVVDTTTNAQQILRVVSPGTMTGTGIEVQSGSDRSIGENVAFLSEASFEQTAQSVYSAVDVDDDLDANAVTRVCEPRPPEPPPMSSPEAPTLRRPVPIPLPPPPPLTRPDTTMRASLPAIPLPVAPLPPPVPPPERLSLGGNALASPVPFGIWGSGQPEARNIQPGPLPPPTPPPDRASRPILPLPPPTIAPNVTPDVLSEAEDAQQQSRRRIATPKRLAIAVIVLVLAGVACFLVSRDKPEAKTNQIAPTTERIGSAPPPPEPPALEPPNAASEVNANGADTKAPMNGTPSEADRHEQETAPPKTTPPKTNKSPVDRGRTPSSKRRRETLY